jgi:hypothetical protein
MMTASLPGSSTWCMAAAAVLVRDPLRDLALAVQALDYAQKIEVATALRTTPMRLSVWADLVIEAHS